MKRRRPASWAQLAWLTSALHSSERFTFNDRRRATDQATGAKSPSTRSTLSN